MAAKLQMSRFTVSVEPYAPFQDPTPLLAAFCLAPKRACLTCLLFQQQQRGCERHAKRTAAGIPTCSPTV